MMIPVHLPSLWALSICLAAAIAEGALSGTGVKARIGELRNPGFGPTVWVWVLIGMAYYVLFFFVLRSLLTLQPTIHWTVAAIALTTLLLILNAGWNWVFFRKKNLRWSFLFFGPYLTVALLLAVVLRLLGNPLLPWYLLYLAYLVWATWWSYRVWRLNSI
jgi:hypothetical protein